MRSKTVSRRGLIVGTAASIAAPAPPERYLFEQLRESLAMGYARLEVARDVACRIRGIRQGWSLNVRAVFE